VQPSGIAAVLSARNSTQWSIDAIQHELKEILEAHKLKATAQAVAALGGSGGDAPPDQGAVNITEKLVNIGKDLAGVETERAKLLLQENQALRERLEQLEERLRERRGEERRENMDFMQAMAQTQSTLIQLAVGLLQEQRSAQTQLIQQLLEIGRPQQDDPLRQIGMQTIMSALQRDPDQDLDRLLDRMEKFRQRLGMGQGSNISHLELYKFTKQLELELEKWRAQQELEREKLEVDKQKAANQAQALSRLGEAIAGRFGPGTAPTPTGEAPTPPPSRRSLYRYRCLACNGNAIFEAPVAEYDCPYCRTHVQVQQPQEGAAGS
jgi:hypothetical protein